MDTVPVQSTAIVIIDWFRVVSDHGVIYIFRTNLCESEKCRDKRWLSMFKGDLGRVFWLLKSRDTVPSGPLLH